MVPLMIQIILLFSLNCGADGGFEFEQHFTETRVCPTKRNKLLISYTTQTKRGK
jgi:hypothetical protein